MSRLPTFDPARTFDMTGLSGSYQDVGVVMASAVVGFVMYNTSDVDCQLSFDDGTTDTIIIPAGGTFSSSRFSQITNQENITYLIAEGAQIQVKQITGAGTTGDLYINIVRI